LIQKADVLDVVRQTEFDILLTIGAGDLEDYAGAIAAIVENEK
jgi:hypothetical protein